MLFRVLFHPRQFERFERFLFQIHFWLCSIIIRIWKNQKKATKRGWEGRGRAGDEMLILQWLCYGEGSEVRTEGWGEPPPLRSGRSTDETGWKSEGLRTYLPFLQSLAASPPLSVLLLGSSSSLPISRPSVRPSVFCPDWGEGQGGEMHDRSASSGRTLRKIIRQYFKTEPRVRDEEWWNKSKDGGQSWRASG